MSVKSFILSFLVFALLIGCSQKEEKKTQEQLPKGVHKVTVVEFQDVPSYTYLKVADNGKEYWIAVPSITVKKGETLYFSQAMEMKDFESTTLKRTFKSILFVQDISKTLKPAKVTTSRSNQMAPLPAHSKDQEVKKEPTVKIKKKKGELTIAKLYKTKDSLNGKKVKFKGKVVKYNPNIMGKNWAHLQDGTKSGGNVDITVTLTEPVAVGNIVTVEGTVKTNIDYGYGYAYSVMIQDAKIIK